MIIDEYQFSLQQLAERQGSWPDIARKCEVSYSWLCKFANSKIPNASYVRVHRIATHISNLTYRADRAFFDSARETAPTQATPEETHEARN